MTPATEFRTVPGFPSYAVNRLGHVKRTRPFQHFGAGRPVSRWKTGGQINSRVVDLWRNGKRHSVTTARLLQTAFGVPRREAIETPRGERQHLAKLTADEVLRAREMHRDGESFHALARHFNVARSTITRAVKGETWKHLEQTT